MTRRHAWLAASAYLAVALFATWPLALGFATDVPWDLGDSLLNMWILAWDAEQLLAILRGDVGRIATFFDANIFYPAPLTLAYSEHLLPQALQILPVYALTKNAILCYNLLFISTYVLSGLGTFLLVRELTGSSRAGFIGGLLFAFAPYRIAQTGHLQVLSSQWMPFALFGFARYFDSRRVMALAGGALALLLVCLSNNYYLMFFTPFAMAYVLWEIARRGEWRNGRRWGELAVASGAFLAILVPFLLPYVRARGQQSMERSVDTLAGYSADVYSYWTAHSLQNIWGSRLQLFPRSEGELFPGAVPVFLGIIAIFAWLLDGWREGRTIPAARRIVTVPLGLLAAAASLVALLAIYRRRLVIDLGATITVTDVGRVLLLIALLVTALAAVSPRARARLRGLVTPLGFFCVATAAAWWLSLGPRPTTLGRPLDLPSPYTLLYDLVPGFDGIRVPARYAMVLALMLAVAAAIAAARYLRGCTGVIAAAVISMLFIAEAHAVPFVINGMSPIPQVILPEARIHPSRQAPPIYDHVARGPRDAVLLELPLGQPDWDLRAVYYSTVHWRPIVNGYSGFFPPGYGLLALALSASGQDPAVATDALRGSGATHVMVHESAFREAEVRQIRMWLAGIGSRLVAREGPDTLYQLSR